MQPIPRRIEGNFSQGWGVALFIIALVAGLFTTAGMIHKKTYRHPRDVTGEYRRQEAPKGEAAAGERAH
jgi:hypothetical protein